MKNITPSQALQNLYQASRLATLTAEQHEAMAQSAKVLNDIINPKPAEEAK